MQMAEDSGKRLELISQIVSASAEDGEHPEVLEESLEISLERMEKGGT